MEPDAARQARQRPLFIHPGRHRRPRPGGGDAIIPSTWRYFSIAGLFLAVYYLGFSVVYPVARAVPVLLMALLDMLRGHPPTLVGWLGLLQPLGSSSLRSNIITSGVLCTR